MTRQAEGLILFKTDSDGIATLTLNRPEKLNAFTPEMIDEWHAAIVAAAGDASVRVLVVTGAGRAFCAGGDVGKLQERSSLDALARKDSLWRRVHRIPLAMEAFDKPVIVAINGLARGAGLDMALMSDIRYMAASATMSESYIDIGVVAGDGGAYYLPRLIGMDKALELFWTGRVVDAAEAERLGIVTRVLPDHELLPATYELARRIAAQPSEAIRAYKRLAYQSLDLSLAAHLDMVSSHSAVLRDTQEHRDLVAQLAARKGGKN